MDFIELLITDVTEMHHGNYCVAGWNSAAQKMVRPLPNGSNWTENQLAKYGVEPGVTIQLRAGSMTGRTYPHATEDMQIDIGSVSRVRKPPCAWFGDTVPPLAATLAGAFEENVQTTGVWNGARKGAFVAEATRTGSLGAVRIARSNLMFFEDDYRGKKSLRAHVTDRDAR